MDEPRTRASLLREGWTQRDLEAAVRRNDLARVVRGSYAPPAERTPRDEHLLRVRALTPALHPDSVVSHISAAVVHGLSVPDDSLVDVHVTRSDATHGRRTRNVVVHVAALAPAEVVTDDGLRVTSLARTVTDLARILDFGWGVVAADEALARGVLRSALLPRPEDARRRRTSRVRAVANFADARSGSPLESRSRVYLAGGGIPAPTLQYEVLDEASGFVARADFAWPAFKVIGEADGLLKYGVLLRPGETAVDAVAREKAREQRLRDLGWTVVRWNWRECHDGTMTRRVRQALVERGWAAIAA